MKTLLTLLLLAASAFGQTATISDTIRTPFGGTFSGTVTVSLNSPALAQPLYSGSVTLSGWTQAVTVTAGVFTLTLYTNDLITPGGTSYTATYAPTSGSGWKETWIVPTGATTIREIRSTTVPSPSVRFNPSQITQAGATLGQGLKWDGSKWAPADVVANPMTTNGDLISRLGGVPVRVGIGSTNQVLTVSGGMPVWASGITGNASTATALAANGTNCSAGSYPLGVDASGNAEGCTAAVTASTGLSDSADIVRGGAALSTPGSVPFVTSSGVLGQSGNLFWDNANGRLGVGTNTPSQRVQIASGNVFISTVGQSLYLGGITDSGTDGMRLFNNGSLSYIDTKGGGLVIRSDATFGSTERARFAATTGNLLLGTTTDDGTNRLQVAGNMRMAANTPKLIMRDTASGTADFEFQASGNILNINRAGVAVLGTIDYLNGSFTWHNQTPTTGSTSLVVRAGAGQGSNNLTTWQNSAGAAVATINSSGQLTTIGSGTSLTLVGNNGFGNPTITTSGGFFALAELGFSFAGSAAEFFRRRASGIIEASSGTAIGTTPGNARDIMARGFYAAETTTDPSAADLSIAGSNAQDTFRLYMKNDKLVIAYQRSGTVNYLTIPLDGATTTFTQSTTAP